MPESSSSEKSQVGRPVGIVRFWCTGSGQNCRVLELGRPPKRGAMFWRERPESWRFDRGGSGRRRGGSGAKRCLARVCGGFPNAIFWLIVGICPAGREGGAGARGRWARAARMRVAHPGRGRGSRPVGTWVLDAGAGARDARGGWNVRIPGGSGRRDAAWAWRRVAMAAASRGAAAAARRAASGRVCSGWAERETARPGTPPPLSLWSRREIYKFRDKWVGQAWDKRDRRPLTPCWVGFGAWWVLGQAWDKEGPRGLPLEGAGL